MGLPLQSRILRFEAFSCPFRLLFAIPEPLCFEASPILFSLSSFVGRVGFTSWKYLLILKHPFSDAVSFLPVDFVMLLVLKMCFEGEAKYIGGSMRQSNLLLQWFHCRTGELEYNIAYTLWLGFSSSSFSGFPAGPPRLGHYGGNISKVERQTFQSCLMEIAGHFADRDGDRLVNKNELVASCLPTLINCWWQ